MDLPAEFACPACGAPIKTDREDLTAEREVVCPGCGRPVLLKTGSGPEVAGGAGGSGPRRGA
ncbi:MAG: hypothetical protein HY900_05885 [Deltaproteobacteria bacterium]|nr:hypothetical protein [Deltaproteobacteria bacterium]